jgi:hypothetical protein
MNFGFLRSEGHGTNVISLSLRRARVMEEERKAALGRAPRSG